MEAETIITEPKIIKEILESLKKKPSKEAVEQNKRALELLKKARGG